MFSSAFLLFPLVERVTNAKQVQMMTGVNPVIFWLSNLVWDFGLFFLSSLLLFMMVSILDTTYTYTTHGKLTLFSILPFTGIFKKITVAPCTYDSVL